MAFRALKNAIVNWGRVQLAIAKWGYGKDEERWIAVERPDLGFQIESVRGEDLPDPETIDLELDNFKPTSETENQEEIKWALEQGLIDPRSALDALDLGRGLNALFASQTRHYARARMENLKLQRGEYVARSFAATGEEIPPGNELPPDATTLFFNDDGTPFFLPIHDDHAIHHLVHQEIILDDTQPAAFRQAVMAHDAPHVQQLMQQLAAQPAGEEPGDDTSAGEEPGAEPSNEIAA
jgi:hypothetical protein